MTRPASQNRNVRDLVYAAIVAVPAVLSWCFFRLVRAFLRKAKEKYIQKHPESGCAWQVLDREFVRKPLVLPVIMTGGPRWNTHALIGTLGPISVSDKIELEASPARASAREWFFVVYSYPDNKTVGSVSSLTDTGSEWVDYRVPQPGLYMIGARYYHRTDQAIFPPVRADGIPFAYAKMTEARNEELLTDLAERQNGFYRFLSFYVSPMLRLRGWLPASLVEREYLPVGNPETEFIYGLLRRRERLRFQIATNLLKTHDVYVSMYSKYSFPTVSYELDAASLHSGPVAPVDGFYLVRVQRKKGDRGEGAQAGESIVVTVEQADHAAA